MVMNGGIYLLNLVDYSVSGFPLLFVGILEAVAISWIYGEYSGFLLLAFFVFGVNDIGLEAVTVCCKEE